MKRLLTFVSFILFVFVLGCDTDSDSFKAVDDEYTIKEDEVRVFPVVSNDDLANSQVDIVETSIPEHGTIEVLSRVTLRYTPEQDFSGTDAFTYTIKDGKGNQATANVSVTIEPANDPPNTQPDVATTPANTTIEIDVLANDEDPDGDTISIAALSLPARGQATFTETSVTYEPQNNYVGVERFSYTATDPDGATTTAAIEVNVISPTELSVASDDYVETNEEVALPVSVTANDYIAAAPMLLTTVSGAEHGETIITQGDKVLYTPYENFSGNDQFVYHAVDGNNWQTSATVYVTVRNVNDPPVPENDRTTTAARPVTFVVLENDFDPDADPLHVVSVATPTMGTAVVNDDNTITYTPGSEFTGDDVFNYTMADSQDVSASAEILVRYDESCAGTFYNCNLGIWDGCETDIMESRNHCGECDNRCPSGERCQAGTCIPDCAEGTANCDGDDSNGCEVDLNNSDQNCGSCGNACTGATHCEGGECVDGCREGFGDCDGETSNGCETSFAANGDHCGACDAPCSETSFCDQGACTECNTDTLDCDGDGANACEEALPLVSDLHCGACNNLCPEGESCDAGTCVTGCATGTADCDANPDDCETDTDTNTDHCGACDNPCQPGEWCNQGTCDASCPPDTEDCDGQPGCEADLTSNATCGDCQVSCNNLEYCDAGSCASCAADTGDCNDDPSDACETDLLTDALHCGACNDPCNGGESCIAGLCSAECQPGFEDCDTDPTDCETDTNASNLHCGGCNNPCTAETETCNAGTCDTCAADTGECDADATNGCETDLTTDLNCGACGVTCGDADFCDAGSCTPCGADLGNCDGDASNGCETSLLDNNDHCGACGNACTSPAVCTGSACL